jgi:hypothetical protein
MNNNYFAGELVKMCKEWLDQHPELRDERENVVHSFVNHCVTTLLGGGDLGIHMNERINLREKIG